MIHQEPVSSVAIGGLPIDEEQVKGILTLCGQCTFTDPTQHQMLSIWSASSWPQVDAVFDLGGGRELSCWQQGVPATALLNAQGKARRWRGGDRLVSAVARIRTNCLPMESKAECAVRIGILLSGAGAHERDVRWTVEARGVSAETRSRVGKLVLVWLLRSAGCEGVMDDPIAYVRRAGMKVRFPDFPRMGDGTLSLATKNASIPALVGSIAADGNILIDSLRLSTPHVEEMIDEARCVFQACGAMPVMRLQGAARSEQRRTLVSYVQYEGHEWLPIGQHSWMDHSYPGLMVETAFGVTRWVDETRRVVAISNIVDDAELTALCADAAGVPFEVVEAPTA